jgi:TRAP-type mannitol/chloroaromatic compound transport system substrate-binding protein
MAVTVTRKIVVNGKEYHSVDELPPDVRALYDKAMASADKKVTVNRITINGVDVVKTQTSKTTVAIIVLAVLAGIAFALYRGL